jgi:hypothetical protein
VYLSEAQKIRPKVVPADTGVKKSRKSMAPPPKPVADEEETF